MKNVFHSLRRWRLAALISCSYVALSLQALGGEYLPVVLKAEWIMDVTFQAPDGTISKGTARRKTEEIVEKDGKIFYRSRSSIEGGGYPRQEYTKLVRKDATGFYSIDERSAKPIEEIEVVLPLEVGKSWKTKGGPMTATHTVVAKETVKIGERTYDNVFKIRIVSDDGKYVEDYWEAPEVGNIKAEIMVQGGKITLTLREFKPGENP